MARLLRAGASSSAVIFYPSARVFHPVENTGLISQHFAWGSLPRLFCQRFVLVLCRSVSAFPFPHGAPAQGGRVVLRCNFLSLRTRFSPCGKHGPDKSAFCLGFFAVRFQLFLSRMARLLRAGASSSAVIFYPSARVFHPVENTGLLAGLAAPWRFLQNFYKFFILSFDTSVFISLK